eukprot:scaffold61251_cov57-Phaeocystis_antarctica.AAC.4
MLLRTVHSTLVVKSPSPPSNFEAALRNIVDTLYSGARLLLGRPLYPSRSPRHSRVRGLAGKIVAISSARTRGSTHRIRPHAP